MHFSPKPNTFDTMKPNKPYHFFHQCLLVVAFLIAANTTIHSVTYLAEQAEVEEEASEWIKEIDSQAEYELGDGNNDNNTPCFLPTAYWTPSKLFSFLWKNDSNTIPTSIETIAPIFPCPLYLLFQQLKLDC